MRKFVMTMVAIVLLGSFAVASTSDNASACAGLIGSNGAVNLGRTTTLAAYHDGVEHYVTAFQFLGGGGQFGTLIPLPGVPSNVEKGGSWTLQRLVRETTPVRAFAAASATNAARSADGVEVLQQVKIDALDVSVLKGGGKDVAIWATQHGFRLSPDAPEVLDFYAARSPIFLAAVFDGEAAKKRGQQVGDGTPVHLTIPLANPWVPLRILALGKKAGDAVNADVFLLTDSKPALLQPAGAGFSVTHSQAATTSLLTDLRSDVGMGWIPKSAWLTKMEINATATEMRSDLAIDASGKGRPSLVAAGLKLPTVADDQDNWVLAGWLVLVAIIGVAALAVVVLRRKQSGRQSA